MLKIMGNKPCPKVILETTRLATASRNGTNRIYFLRIEDLVAFDKPYVTRSLTTEESARCDMS